MTYVTLKINTHRGYIIAAVLVIAALAAVFYGFSCYNSNVVAARVVLESAAEKITANDIGEETNVEPAKYSLGSIQTDSIIKAVPGNEINTGIDFYNIDGNLTTYITLAVTESPEGWKIELTPGLAIEVTRLLAEPADDVQEGEKFVKLGDRGYTVARTGTVKITVPDDAEAGAEIIITAKAEWHDQTGQAVISQTRDFSYSVLIAE